MNEKCNDVYNILPINSLIDLLEKRNMQVTIKNGKIVKIEEIEDEMTNGMKYRSSSRIISFSN